MCGFLVSLLSGSLRFGQYIQWYNDVLKQDDDSQHESRHGCLEGSCGGWQRVESCNPLTQGFGHAQSARSSAGSSEGGQTGGGCERECESSFCQGLEKGSEMKKGESKVLFGGGESGGGGGGGGHCLLLCQVGWYLSFFFIAVSGGRWSAVAVDGGSTRCFFGVVSISNQKARLIQCKKE